MALGKLTDYQLISNPANPADPINKPSKKNALRTKLATCMEAQLYFMQVNGAVYHREQGDRDANILIGCSGDFRNAVPKHAAFKAFKTGQRFAIGYVSLNQATKELKLIDTSVSEEPILKSGLVYEHVGQHGSKEIYARLDRVAIKALSSGSHLSEAILKSYETSMRKGVIPSGSTGSDGIKFDHQAWVIKITISIAQAIGADNTLSPMADALTEGNKIYLNFNKLTLRH